MLWEIELHFRHVRLRLLMEEEEDAIGGGRRELGSWRLKQVGQNDVR